MMLQFCISFAIPMVISLIITPWIIRLAYIAGALDKPNERKIHSSPTPRLGGIAIFVSFCLTLIGLMLLSGTFSFAAMFAPSPKLSMYLVSILLVVALGAWDDIRTLTPGQKVAVQLVAGTIIYLAGFRIGAITHPMNSGHLNLGLFDYPATLLWTIGVTNAINLIDGLDGLASGVTIIASLTIFAISLLGGDLKTAIIVLVLAGSVAGFLRYNFNPARIFLGDSGSLFLGFSLAVFSIQSSTKGSTAVAILVPILALGLPIMDTLISMARRFLRPSPSPDSRPETLMNRLASIFSPDREHIHHRLIAMGLSHRSVVLLLYLVSCIFGAGAFAVTVTNNLGASYILAAAAVATVIGVRQLQYREMALLRNGVLLPLYEWPVMNHTLFQGFLDLVFICIAASLSAAIGAQTGQGFLAAQMSHAFSALAIASIVQLIVFSLFGIYSSTYRTLGLEELLTILKTVAASTLLAGGVLLLIPQVRAFVTVSTLVVNFYILLTLVMGSRVSYHVLYYLSRKGRRTGKRVLICGADAGGTLVLQQMQNDEELHLCPVGFLDEDPELEGKRLNGYPIFGGHWKLPQVLRREHIDELVLNGKPLPPEVMMRLRKIAMENHIAIRRFRVGYEYLPLDREEDAKAEEAAAARAVPGAHGEPARTRAQSPVIRIVPGNPAPAPGGGFSRLAPSK